MKALTFLHMSMLKELIQEKHSREKSKSNDRGVCPIFRGIAHIQFNSQYQCV